MKHTILCVDDEIDNVDALERLFRKKYNVLKAVSGDEGLVHVQDNLGTKNPVALIISDQRMPGKTGVEFLRETIALSPETIRILLTGYTDIDSVIAAINSGEVYRYITKPWDPVDIVNTVDKALEKYELSAELEIKNRELRQALDELKVLDESKNKFMILINHELKTPLTVMLSFSELLKETELDEEQKMFLKRIIESSERLKRMVDDAMLFVSAEVGQLKISRKKIDLTKITDRISAKFQEETEKKGQNIEVDFESASVKADPKVMEEVLDRLIHNAIKFGKEKSTVRVVSETDSDQMHIYVENEGKAVSKKIIAAVNKPFNLDEDIMKHSEGLGLGLSLSQALLKAHESGLEFETPKGKTRVGFRL